MSKSLILLGVKHSGKTSLGLILAKRLNVPFFDIDEIIEKQTGTSCRKIYQDAGVSVFKNAETAACRFFDIQLLALPPNGKITAVAASGGGICDNPAALDILRPRSIFIYLNVSKRTAAERIFLASKKAGSFPAFLAKENIQSKEDIEAAFHTLYLKRSAAYRKIADIIINAKNLAPEQLCDATLNALKESLQ